MTKKDPKDFTDEDIDAAVEAMIANAEAEIAAMPEGKAKEQKRALLEAAIALS